MTINGDMIVSITGNCVAKLYLIVVFCIILTSVNSSEKLSKNDQVLDDGLSLVGEDMIILDRVITILPTETIPILITKQQIPSGSQFVVVQAHSHNFNLTISYNQTLIPRYHVNGTNVGLVVPVQNSPFSDTYKIYVTNFNVSRNISALVAAVAYLKNVPVPGGCNMVFPIETSPFLGISYDSAVVRVDVQPASPPEISLETCEYSSVELELYHRYFPEGDYTADTYFAEIRKMLTVDRIRNSGSKVNDRLEGAMLRRLFGAYTGTGSTYGVVAVYEENGKRYESAYIPSVTYACSTVLWADTCQVLTTTFSKVVCAVLFFMGLFLCLLGHFFFQSQIFIHSFLSGGLISVILLFPYLHSGLYPASICFAVSLALICVFFWRICSLPLFHVILITLNIGFLLASIVFYAGLGDIDLMEIDSNFWVAFTVILLFAPAVLVCLSHKACIIASGILGAYAVVVPIDHYIGSNLKFIILNTIRRATVSEFRSAVISPPYQYKDFALTVLWLALSVVGISLQLLIQRISPPFPPPPREVCTICRSFWRTSRSRVGEWSPLWIAAQIPQRTPPEGYDDVFVPNPDPSAPPSYGAVSSSHVVFTT